MHCLNTTSLKRWIILLFIVLPLMSACGKAKKGDDVDAGFASLKLELISVKGQPVEGVSAMIGEQNAGSSDANGTLVISKLSPNSDVSIKLLKDGYANQVYRYKTGPDGAADTGAVTLIPREAAVTFSTDAPTALSGSFGAKVSLKGSDFVDKSGKVVEGDINLTMTPVDVSTPAGLEAFPGSFSAVNEQGEDEPVLVTYGTTEYQFTRDGEEVQLGEDKKVAIELPIFIETHPDGTPVKLGDTIPLWYLNEETGIWHQEGTGTVVASQASKTGFALRGEVTHFSWWNVDVAPEGTRVRFNVSLSGSTAGLSNFQARVFVSGSGFSMSNVAVPYGTFSQPIPVPANQTHCFYAIVNATNNQDQTVAFRSPNKCVSTPSGQTSDIVLSASAIANFSLTEQVVDKATVGGDIAACGISSRLSPNNQIPPVSYKITAGVLPEGLTLNSATGFISGTPTANAEGASGQITVTATDAANRTADASFSLDISSALATSTATVELPLMTIGDSVNYVGLLDLSGGLAPYSYTVLGSSPLPNNLVLNSSNGTISGSPSANSFNGVKQAFVSTDSAIKLRDANCAEILISVSSNVVNPPALAGTPPASLSEGAAISFTATNNGGAVEEWNLGNNPAAAWLSIDPTTGELLGTPGSGDVASYTGIEIVARNNLGNAPFPVGESRYTFDLNVTPAASGEQTINFQISESQITRSAGSVPFINAIVDNGMGTGAVTYVSSNPSAATVHPATGLVTPLLDGETVMITATKAADSVYSQATASYELIIANTAPIVDVASNIQFDVTDVRQTFTYTPTLLSSGLEVTWSWSGINLRNSSWGWISFNAQTGELQINEVDNFDAGVYEGTLSATNTEGTTVYTPIAITLMPQTIPNITTRIGGSTLVLGHDEYFSSVVLQNVGGFADASDWIVSGDFPNPEDNWITITSYDWAPQDVMLNINPDIKYLGKHKVTITAKNPKGSDSITLDLEIRLDMPYLTVMAYQNVLGVEWSLPSTPVPISYELYLSDQGEVTPDNYSAVTADLVTSYTSGLKINTVNELEVSDGKAYHLMLVAKYAGLETRSTPMTALISKLADTGNSQCNIGAGIQYYVCGNTYYPEQDADLGLDAETRIANANNYTYGRFSLFDSGSAQAVEDKTCIRDNQTGLVWEYLPKPETILAADLAAHVAVANATPKCGRSDWRLPTTNELLAIVNYGVAYSSGTNNSGVTMGWNQFFNLNTQQLFSNPTKRYWTSDRANPATPTSGRTWYVDFGGGNVEHNTNVGVVRAILVSDADAPIAPVTRFTDNTNGTVSDNLTGLTWKRCPEGYLYDANACVLNDTVDVSTFTWQEALQRAQSANNGDPNLQNHDSSDWRVPNITELNSIIQREKGQANMFDTGLFPGTETGSYWSSTSRNGGIDVRSWSAILRDAGDGLAGRVTPQPIIDSYSLMLVRGNTAKGNNYRWYPDNDGDRYVDMKNYVDGPTRPSSTYYRFYEPLVWELGIDFTHDCNDSDEFVYPYNFEDPSDGKDNNCNGVVDEGEPAGGEG